MLCQYGANPLAQCNNKFRQLVAIAPRDADGYRVAFLARGADERCVACVERAHGGDEDDGFVAGALPARPLAEFGDGVEDLHG